jgi:uncharacterized protein YeaO (DUF488 family)
VTLRIVRLGEPRDPQEGTRIGTVRRPPRGVRKEHYARDDWFDVWYPDLAPSAALMEQETEWKGFVRAFKAEMNVPAARRALDLLARSRMAPTFRSAVTAKTKPAATGRCFASY